MPLLGTLGSSKPADNSDYSERFGWLFSGMSKKIKVKILHFFFPNEKLTGLGFKLLGRKLFLTAGYSRTPLTSAEGVCTSSSI